MMMMMKRSIVLFVVIITMVNNMGLCYGTRVAHSVTMVPSNRCYIEGEYCSALPWQMKICCEGFSCEGFLSSENRCVKVADCRELGHPCALFNACCYPYQCSGTTSPGSVCVVPSSTTTTTTTTTSTPSSILSLSHVDE
ncbi:hypothetical protein CsatA_005673 [Cannabis sativa]